MIRVVKAFDFYHDGITPTHYPEGLQPIPPDAAAVALAQGWVTKEDKPPSAPPAKRKRRGQVKAG